MLAAADRPAGLLDCPQLARFPKEPGIFFAVGRRRRNAHQLSKHRAVGVAQFTDNCHGVNGLIGEEELADRLKHMPVGAVRKVRRLQLGHEHRDAPVVEQHRAEHGGLRSQI